MCMVFSLVVYFNGKAKYLKVFMSSYDMQTCIAGYKHGTS